MASSINAFDSLNFDYISYSTLSFTLITKELKPYANGALGISHAERIFLILSIYKINIHSYSFFLFNAQPKHPK